MIKKNFTAPYGYLKIHPWEYYYKGTAVGSCPELGDDPGKSPQNKPLRIT